MRQRFVWDERTSRLVEVPPDYRPKPRRFHIIGDTTEPFRSMADGTHYTSKGRYRAELKARGFEEVGNEFAAVTQREFRPNDWAADLCETAAEMGVGNADEIKVRDVIDA